MKDRVVIDNQPIISSSKVVDMSDFDNYGSKVTKVKEPNSIRQNTFLSGRDLNSK